MISYKKNFLLNISNTVVSQFFVGVLYIFIIPIAIHNLGEEFFGLVLILSFLMPSDLLGQFNPGIHRIISKRVSSGEENDLRSYLKNMLKICLLLGLALSFILLLIKNYIPTWTNISGTDLKNQMSSSIAVIAFCAPFGFISFVPMGYLDGIFKTHFVRVIENLNQTFKILSYLALSLSPSLLTHFAYALLGISSLSCFTLFFLAYKNNMRISKYGGNIKEILIKEKSLFSTFFLLNITGFSFRNLNQLLVSVLLGPIFLTYYELATKFSFFFKVVVSKCVEPVLPLSSKYKNQKKKLKDALTRILQFTTVASIFFFSIILVSKSLIIKLWLGEKFLHLENLMLISSLILLIHPYASIFNFILLGQLEKTKLVVKISLFSTLISIITTLSTYKNI
ncbi:MAG: oligosaccharide flippase family protein, partial [Bacteriovoracales bacterium]|nr:oligosaccharide flippase family protein [Bacteriovoracales bacterium]